MKVDAHSAVVRWQDGMRFEGNAHPEEVIALDSDPEHGGQEAGVQPMDLLLVGLASCTGMEVLIILKKMRQSVTSLEVRASGTRAEDYPRVFTQIDVTYLITGEEVAPRAVERAITLSETRYCPVWAMLAESVAITSHYEIIKA